MSTPSGTDDQDAVFDYGVDDRDGDVLDLETALGEDGEDEVADTWTVPDEAVGVDQAGTTVDEQRAGEDLDERELRMLPEGVADVVDGDALPAEQAAIHSLDPLPEGADGGAFPEAYAVDEGRTAG